MGEIYPQLEAAIERHITQLGVREFIVGNYGGFDRIAARALVAAKAQHPEIVLLLLVPYHPAERPIQAPPGFDGTFYPPGMENVPRKFAIVRANRYMVEHVNYMIAYVWHPASNARDLVAYAIRKGVAVVNLGKSQSISI
jgi:hypothetical protein